MEAKENRPDACTASGTAKSIYKYFSTDTPDIQEELTGPFLPDDCAADIVSFCSEQTIAYDDLLEYATLFYLQDIDPENPPSRDTLKFELLTLTNSCIDAYNLGKRNPNAPAGAKPKDAYPDQKQGAERYKRLSGLHTLQIAIILYKLHHAVGILWNNSHDDGNFDIGIYQYSGDNEGCYDVGEQNLKSLIRSYCKTGTIKDVNETIETLRAICPRVERCRDRDLVAVNNGIYDYGNKILMAFDPAFVFTSKKHVDFVDRARNPIIHNNEDGTDWDVVSWMNELSDDPDVVSLLWQIIGATVRPYVSWNKSAWLYSPSGNNGKGTLCTLLRNLCGPGDWTSIPLKNFGKDFMLTSLMHASVIITDENDTGTFVDDAASLKSIITGDPFQMNRKNRDPRDVLFNGFMVQCVNEIPRVRDKSESMLRRLLVIPFKKRFQGKERKYIKDDYLHRKDVLEYVLYHVLAETDYYELDEPEACLELLDEFRLTNDPVRQFLDDILIRATWDVLPWQFVFDLYRHWFMRNNPSGRCQSRKSLINDVKEIISDYEGWDYSDNPVSIPDEMYEMPEGLIGMYGVLEWEEQGYRGTNASRSRSYHGSKRTRGLVRMGVAASEDAAVTDSTNKEE